MVGKLLPNGIFYHAAKPDQFHIKYRCSYPIDVKLIDFLYKNRVSTIHCGRHNSVTMLETTPVDVSSANIHDWGERLRYYLPDDLWARTQRDYNIPWITDEITL